MTSFNDVQVGGNHYRKIEGEQHWDRQWRLFGPGYFIGCITKYVERYQDKNGIQDLEKAYHFLGKLIELEKAKQEKEKSGERQRIPTTGEANGSESGTHPGSSHATGAAGNATG